MCLTPEFSRLEQGWNSYTEAAFDGTAAEFWPTGIVSKRNPSGQVCTSELITVRYIFFHFCYHSIVCTTCVVDTSFASSLKVLTLQLESFLQSETWCIYNPLTAPKFERKFPSAPTETLDGQHQA